MSLPGGKMKSEDLLVVGERGESGREGKCRYKQSSPLFLGSDIEDGNELVDKKIEI